MYRNRSKQLDYIHQKLTATMERQTNESLLLFTEDVKLQQLLSDINQLLQYTQQTKATYTKMEQSIRQMLTNMSHDLKTPLSVVLGLSETLTYDQTISDAERICLLRKIYDKAQVMQQLINDFFDLAKLESGDKKLTLIPTALNEICSNNLLFLHEQITTKGLDVSVEIPDEPMVASIDPTALDRVLQNLLANAISYGNDGKMIGIRLRANETHVFIDVWDRGKGIPEQEQSLVFDRLYTLEDSRNRAYQGSGLGLTITKRLVESMGGNLSVKSQPFVETVFTVQLNRSFPHVPIPSGERLS